MSAQNGAARLRVGDGKTAPAALRQGAGPRKSMSGTVPVPERVTVVMRLLAATAEAGLPCPTNEEIAASFGSKSSGTASDVVALLETMNLITVERTRNSRVVTIVATGLSTKRPARVVSADARSAAAASRAANRRKRIALFCDALSSGTPEMPVTIKQAGVVAGVSELTARSFMDEVKRELGWQAA